MRLPVGVAVLLLAGSAAAAGERVDVEDLRVPPLVVVDVPFAANVTVTNRAEATVTAVLYAVLYAPGEGCGAQTDPRFLGVVSFAPAYAEVTLAPGETRPYPAEGARWTWRVGADLVREDATYEVCVFAGEQGATAPPGGLAHADLVRADLRVRPWNEPPHATFAWTPPVANVTTTFTFRASAEDGDGDAVTFAWDFGDRTSKGAATAHGEEVRHRFYPEGTYEVTLTASDGFSLARVARTVQVLPEETPTPVPPPDKATPAAGFAAALAAVAALGRRRR